MNPSPSLWDALSSRRASWDKLVSYPDLQTPPTNSCAGGERRSGRWTGFLTDSWNSKYLICECFDDSLPALPVLLGASVLSLCTFTGLVHVTKHRMS